MTGREDAAQGQCTAGSKQMLALFHSSSLQLNDLRSSFLTLQPPFHCILKCKSKPSVCQSLSHGRLCDPMDCSPPGSSVQGIPLGKNTRVGQPFPSPGHLPHPETEPRSPALQADSLPSEPPEKPQVRLSILAMLEGLKFFRLVDRLEQPS